MTSPMFISRYLTIATEKATGMAMKKIVVISSDSRGAAPAATGAMNRDR